MIGLSGQSDDAQREGKQVMGRSIKNLVGPAVSAGLFLGIVAGIGPAAQPASAGGGAAFLGGMLTAHVVGGAIRRSERRTEAAEYQAYSQPQQAQPAPQQGGGGGSAQSKLDELDALAAKGYITKEEYKSRRKAILDSM